MLVYLFALGAALLFGTGSVVQQRVASTAPPGRSLRPSLLLWLVRQPAWLAGVGTAVVGNLLSGAALGLGSVALVQPLLVSRLLFALPLSAAWQRRRLAGRDWLGLAATAGGLAVFVAVGRPRSRTDQHPAFWQWMVLLAAVAAVTAALVLTARRLLPEREAAMLGAGAGLLFALQSGFTHAAVGGFLGSGITGLLLNWTTYAVAAAALSGTLLAQSAYEMAPLAASYPTLAAVEPLAGIAIGIGLLGTTLTVGVVPLVVLVLALVGMTWGIRLLATSPLVAGERTIMIQRREEEEAAELERVIDHRLHRLQATLTRLDRCRPAAAGAALDPATRECLTTAERLVSQVSTAMQRLAEHNGQVEIDSPDAAGGPQLRALARYQEEICRREEQLRTQAGALAAQFRARRAALGAEG